MRTFRCMFALVIAMVAAVSVGIAPASADNMPTTYATPALDAPEGLSCTGTPSFGAVTCEAEEEEILWMLTVLCQDAITGLKFGLASPAIQGSGSTVVSCGLRRYPVSYEIRLVS
ncbi:hypothetical protein SUDANB121_00011 [Nocardiopsis dassonvillei]